MPDTTIMLGTPGEDKDRINIYVDKATLDRVREDAQREVRSVSGQIQWILNMHYAEPVMGDPCGTSR